MKTLLLRLTLFLGALSPATLLAQDGAAQGSWHAKSLGQALLYMLIFTVVGMALAILGYKLFDRFTPGDLNREIVEHRNVAAALLGAAVIIGTCILVAAAMIS
jgi:putative membrane protein